MCNLRKRACYRENRGKNNTQQKRQQHISSNEITPSEQVVSVRNGLTLQINSYAGLPFAKIRPVPGNLGARGNCGKGCCGSELLLQVRRDDIEEVLTILEQEYRIKTGLEYFDTTYAAAVYDATAEQATCPDCGLCFE